MPPYSDIVKQGFNAREELNQSLGETINEVKKSEVDKSTANLLTHDQFETAFKVANADGQVDKAEQEFLNEIRKKEHNVDIFSHKASESVKQSIDELQGMVKNQKQTRITKYQALRLAYDMANINGAVSSKESEMIEQILGKSLKPDKEPEQKPETNRFRLKDSAQSITEIFCLPKPKIQDPFIAALLMAIENDGEIDDQELKHLKKLEKRTSDEDVVVKERKRYRGVFSFNFRFHSPFSFSFISECERKNRKALVQKKPKLELNHNLREAFKVAALDGLVSTTEIANLKKLF